MNSCENYAWLMDVTEKILLPFIVGALSYIIFRGLDENKKRKNSSLLGVIILRSLLEEVNTGIDIIKSNLDNKDVRLHNMPSASWINVNTIPDEVLLRIIVVSKSVKSDGDFHPKDIRSHTKNYFEHMCVTWRNDVRIAAEANQNGLPIPARLNETAKVFERPAEHVKILLEQTIQLLESNSVKWFPK